MKKAGGYFLSVLFLLYIILLLRITVFRPGFSLVGLMENGTVNLTLFQDYIPLIRQGRWYRFVYLFVGNIVWFVPFGSALLASGAVRRVRTAALCGFLLSLAIETMQYIFGTGVSELDDLVLNTLGAWAGAVTVQLYLSYRSRAGRKNRKEDE